MLHFFPQTRLREQRPLERKAKNRQTIIAYFMMNQLEEEVIGDSEHPSIYKVAISTDEELSILRNCRGSILCMRTGDRTLEMFASI